MADKQADESLVSGQLVDSITNNSNIRIFSRKCFELTRMDAFFDQLLASFKRKEGFLVILSSMQGLMIAIMMVYISLNPNGSFSLKTNALCSF